MDGYIVQFNAVGQRVGVRPMVSTVGRPRLAANARRLERLERELAQDRQRLQAAERRQQSSARPAKRW